MSVSSIEKGSPDVVGKGHPLRQSPWVLGNWKMNPLRQSDAQNLAATVAQRAAGWSGCRVAIAPTTLHVSAIAAQQRDSGLLLMAQDLAANSGTGAYTGDVSAQMLVDSGVQMVLVGHSERRQVHQESAQLLTEKMQAALDAGLLVVLCVGESLAERETGNAAKIVLSQLHEQVTQISPAQWRQQVIVAYEPVWAIGTGRTASPADAQIMHATIRAYLRERDAGLENTPLLYGGSVKPDNAAQLASCSDVDGALVGGAALDAESFFQIVQAFTAAV